MTRIFFNSSSQETIIRPYEKWRLLDIREIWHYRELFYIFAWRDIKIRYRQTLIGIIYVVLQPIASMLIFTVFFGNLAKIPSGSLPYSVFVLTGLVFWNFFSGALTRISNSMLDNVDIITKVYFPKIILPLAAIITFFIDFLINLVILLILAAFLGNIPNIRIVYILPLMVLLMSITVAGIGLLLASINVKYRDIKNILPFVIQIMLFLTPIIYPLTIMRGSNRLIMALNPMTTVVEVMRTSFTRDMNINPVIIFISIISAFSVLLIGLWYFRKTEKFFADIV